MDKYGINKGRDCIVIHWITDVHLKDSVTGRPEAEGSILRERHFYAAEDKLKEAVAVANREKPDYFICTGDLIDDVQPLDSFNRHWAAVTVPKELMIGNHDLAVGYRQLARELGYDHRPVIAGSHFNRAFSLHKGAARVKVIMLDTYVGADGTHMEGTCEGMLQGEALQWLKREFYETEEKLILVFSHNGIYGPKAYFHQEHVFEFSCLVNQAAAANPGLNIVNLAGHKHVHPSAVVQEIAPYLLFINGVAMIAGTSSYVNVVTIGTDGSIVLGYREVRYSQGMC